MDELKDIQSHFHIIMHHYPDVYANFKMNPNLPSAMSAHDKMESNLTVLYRRMFVFQAEIDKQLEEHENTMKELTLQSSKMNTALANREKSLAALKKMPRGVVKESFITGVGDTPPTQNQISMVHHARDIENSVYYYSIARIIYLVVGISVVSYFIFQTIGDPESTILADVKMKAEQLKSQAPTFSNPIQPDQKINNNG